VALHDHAHCTAVDDENQKEGYTREQYRVTRSLRVAYYTSDQSLYSENVSMVTTSEAATLE